MRAPRSARQQRLRALAHQCPACRRHWALRLVEHPAGNVIVCRFCGTPRNAEVVGAVLDELAEDASRR